MYVDAISRDMSNLLFSSTFKHPSEDEFAKINSDPIPNYHHHQLHHQHYPSPMQQQQLSPPPPPSSQQQQQQSSLLRYRSAPSSFFANLIDATTNGDDDFLNSLSPSTIESVPSDRFFRDGSCDSSRFTNSTILKQEERYSFDPLPPQPQSQQQDHVMYGNNPRAVDLPNHSSGLNMEGSFRVGNSTTSSDKAVLQLDFSLA